MKFDKKSVFGLLLVGLGILLNKWFIETFAADSTIDKVSYIIQIAIFQILLVLVGTYLITRRKVLRRTAVVALILLLVFFIIDLATVFKQYHVTLSLTQREDSKVITPNHIILQRALALEHDKVAQLSQMTSEIQYRLHQTESHMTIKVPEDAILDTATGIDPLITELFAGTVYFELSLLSQGNEPQMLLRRKFELPPLQGEGFSWQNVALDISNFAGREITLVFKKGIQTEDETRSKGVYDLLPTDLMFWRAPSIRPKKLANRHNVILISLDTLRPDHLHFMGYDRDTSPNLDRLAKSGVFFTTVVSQAPWTLPSHFSILTSTYPSVHLGNQPPIVIHRHWNGKLPTMASILKSKGYVTAAFTGGRWVSARFGFNKGFDSYSEAPRYEGSECESDAEAIFAKSERWLKDNRNRSFFLFVHTYEAHSPYCDPFFVREENISESEVIKHRTALYDGDIRRADYFVGKLMETLDELSLTDNTIIAITSDHGEDLGGRNPPEAALQTGHGYNLYDEALLVPLILYDSSTIPHGKHIEHQVRSIDLLPTVLDYLGFAEEASFQGSSLKGMIEGKDQAPRPAYSEATAYGTERESIRANGYKYIYRVSYGQLTEPSSRGLPLTPLHELYDLNLDPHETTNRAAEWKDMVTKYQQLILSLVPEQTFADNEQNLTARDSDTKSDEDLLRNLRSLGYIR